MTTRRPRSDGLRSRAAILDAATVLLRERGADVAMYEVAKRAGVGQGTLYRHFPTWSELAAAVYEDAVGELEAMAAEHADDPALFLRLFRAAIDNQVRFDGLVGFLRAQTDGEPHLRHLTERGSALFERPLRTGVAIGLLREDLRTEDVMTFLAMIEGVLSGVPELADRKRAARNAYRLLEPALRRGP